jgi:hypothetical protein
LKKDYEIITKFILRDEAIINKQLTLEEVKEYRRGSSDKGAE